VVAGLEVSDETLSLDVIREVALGPGHYLGHRQTLARMETDYLYPDLADRSAPSVWEAEGSPDMLQRAQERVHEVLAAHYPDHIDPKLDAAIRDKFPIVLPREVMRWKK
ncbi:MAG: trimethylamine methyltransferase family protein, partial [Anaerolineales bacterium]|nr:trimethylamine methyltransferase family protein [Anaerolineales bacterium]